MKRKTTTIVLVIIFLIGFSVLLYPVVSSYVNQMDATKATEQYDELMKKMENKKSESILNEANLYNENLTKDNVEYKNQEENKYADILNVDDSGSMGYISVPKIKVKIPIKHGTTDEVLSKYVGHLESSSLPVGGESTHAVLVAHRGLPNAKLFTDLDKMEIGDKFQITVLNKKLFYQVEEISVVKPEDISKLSIEKDKDYVTLVTCTPYAVNTHRLLVKGIRIDEDKAEKLDNEQKVNPWKVVIIALDLVLIIMTLFVITFAVCVNKGKRVYEYERESNKKHNNLCV
ncbi:class C sortase [uncultured Eubacterium sp.]|jgi:sortase A|uniref:class C sortase n=1 Tax=uncultured Eubacterium sp. TaxID=165185 RepID=UPI00326337A1